MPTGIMFLHPYYGNLFIDGDDGRWYQPYPEVELAPDTRVSFQDLNDPNAPPGFYFAKDVVEAEVIGGTIAIGPNLSRVIQGDDGAQYKPTPESTLAPGSRVTFQVLGYPDVPPGLGFVKILTSIAASSPPVMTTSSPIQTISTPPPISTTGPTQPAKSPGVWSKVPSSVTTSTVPIVTTKTTASVMPPLPTPSLVTPRTLTGQTLADFNAITNQVGRMNWSQSKGFGPSLQVTTKLKWEGEGIQLYLRVLEEYQDKRIGGTGLYYFVGTMGLNWGKAGFRISAHTHPKAEIRKSTTYSVLHIEN